MKKNSPGYISRYRRTNLIWLIVWLVIGTAVFLTGWFIWHTRANILTVLAVLMVLPGAKRIVALVAAGRKKSISPERCHEVETKVEPFIYICDLDIHEYEPEEEESSDESDEAEAAEPDEAPAEESDEAVVEEPGEAVTEESVETAPVETVRRPARSPYEDPVIPWNVIFTDYIFTSTERVMMLDFMVVTDGTIFILPSSSNQDNDYVKKYLTEGIRKWSTAFDIRFVWDDEKLLSGLDNLQESKAPARDRREVLAYLKSLAL